MILGECPYCDEHMMLACPEKTPVFAFHDCEECGKKIWTKFSCIDPMSWTEKGFLEEYDVDFEKKIINPKNDETS